MTVMIMPIMMMEYIMMFIAITIVTALLSFVTINHIAKVSI